MFRSGRCIPLFLLSSRCSTIDRPSVSEVPTPNLPTRSRQWPFRQLQPAFLLSSCSRVRLTCLTRLLTRQADSAAYLCTITLSHTSRPLIIPDTAHHSLVTTASALHRHVVSPFSGPESPLF